MPEGEEMFYFHGYSGDCPEPPLKKVQLDPAGQPKMELTVLESQAIQVLNSIRAADDAFSLLPVEVQMRLDAVLAMATVRRVGVA
jgi:hypothetical protein